MNILNAAAPAIPEKDRIAALTAKILIDIKAIHFCVDPPYIFTSGWASPVYTDMRKVIAFPRARRRLVDFANTIIEQEIGCEALDVVAGGETAGIPYAAWLAEKMMLPMQYIRKKPKGFGRNARIEGEIVEGARALLVEDLATDGRSKVNFIEALRDSGQVCDNALVFFFYDIFPQARTDMDTLGVKLHYLTTWRDVLAVAKAQHSFPVETLGEVEKFLDAPADWSAAHGGIASFKAG